GTVAKLMFNITGDGQKHTYCLIIKDAKELEVVPGPADDALVTLDMDEATWRDAVTGRLEGAIEMFTDVNKVANRVRFEKLKEIKGTLVLDLTKPDGSPVDLSVTFNGAGEPKAIFKCSLADWASISSGKVSGINAFMGGQLKIEGNMPLAIELSALVG
ncbi:MAG: SCP2 sterol-binding domain-containing protein, partial [Candidatus Geothermincolia bacterium]